VPWVRLDESFADHPKIERVGPLAAWLHVAALCYCARHLTDGALPKAKAHRLADIPDPAEHVAALLREGLWTEDGSAYVLHDYLDYQPSRQDVEAERSAARARMAKKRSAARSPEVPPNENGSSASPSRPDPTTTSLSSSSDSRGPVDNPGDDGIPAAVWTHIADLKLDIEPAGSVRNPGPWKRTTAANAQAELGEQARAWWATFDFDSLPNGAWRLAQCLVDGRAPQHVPRRTP
jgi:hypothetical protein